MRADLNKLLCERERRGSESSFREFRHMRLFTESKGEEFEDLPTRESMKQRYKVSWHEKEFGENLNPLYGFVRKNVNRPWDKVYSELCQVFNMKSVINQHILQHLFDMVELKTFIDDDGELMYRPGYYHQRAAEPVKTEDGPEYYVHPTTGILTKNKYYKSYRQQSNERSRAWKNPAINPLRRVIDDKIELRRKTEDGAWFICEMDTCPRFDTKFKKDEEGNDVPYQVDAYRFDMWDHLTVDHTGRCRWSWSNRHREHRAAKHGAYVKSVRTASKKELKKYGVV